MPLVALMGSFFTRALYRLASALVVLIVRVFFRRLEVAGSENVPAGPVVVAANHPNMLLDPLLVAVALRPRWLHFLAKAPLFRIPVVGPLFKALGVLPVQRKQDSGAKMDDNKGMFQACVDALHAGRSIGIFPEGTSLPDPRIQPLKTGAARILLDAAAAAPEGTPLPRALPVGLNYGDPKTFRSDVLVLFGPAIDPRPYLDRYRLDAAGAAKALTEELQRALEGLTRNLEVAADEPLIARLEKVYRSELFPVGDGLVERFQFSRTVVDGLHHYRRTEPAVVERVEELLDRYFFGLEALGLSGAHLRAGVDGYTLGNVARFLAWAVPPLALTSPLALWGYLANGLPYNLIAPLAERSGVGREEIATKKVLWGMLLFPVTWALWTAAAGYAWGAAAALLLLATLPGSGFVTLWWLDRYRYMARHARTAWVFVTRSGFRERMEGTRAELLEELSRLANAFLAARGRP